MSLEHHKNHEFTNSQLLCHETLTESFYMLTQTISVDLRDTIIIILVVFFASYIKFDTSKCYMHKFIFAN